MSPLPLTKLVTTRDRESKPVFEPSLNTTLPSIPPRSLRTIAVLGNYGNRNLGDEATLVAVIQHVGRRFPQARICGLSLDLPDTHGRHGIEVFPSSRWAIRDGSPVMPPTRASHTFSQSAWAAARQTIKGKVKVFRPLYTFLRTMHAVFQSAKGCCGELVFLIRCFTFLRSIDLLIVAGGGQLDDQWGGPINFPYTIFKWSVLARLTRTRLAFLSVGAGRLDSPVSRILVKRALSMAGYRSLRDERSWKLLRTMGIAAESHVFPDLVYGLETDPRLHQSIEQNRCASVGINPFPHYDYRYYPQSDNMAYRIYVSRIASFAAWLMQRRYRVFFFPTQLRADTRVIQDIRRILEDSGTMIPQKDAFDCPINTIEDLLARISQADIVVSGRFHGILLSFLLNIPVLGISNQSKMDDLMLEMGQGEYLLSADNCPAEEMIRVFTSLEANMKPAKEQIKRRNVEYRQLLEAQFDHLLYDSPSVRNHLSNPGG